MDGRYEAGAELQPFFCAPLPASAPEESENGDKFRQGRIDDVQYEYQYIREDFGRAPRITDKNIHNIQFALLNWCYGCFL